MAAEESVRVVVRCRPLNQREKSLNCGVVVSTFTDAAQVQLARPGAPNDEPPKKFTFDGAYGMDSNSQMIYEDVGFPLIESVLEGYNATIFAYGQTGCGKSFTMEGIPDPPEHCGLTPRSFEHIFQEVAVRENTKFLVRASYLEIYNENVRDLLGADQTATLELKEHPERGVYVKDLTEHVVHNTAEVIKLMAAGSKNRSVGATLMNADSSRSHSIFTIWLEACEQSTDGSDESRLRASKLNLVDLAGSERQSKTGATGDRLKEATKINLSLSALGNVISALVDGKAKHIPYRDSKLTRLLQDSLGGNTKTLMVAAISPADNNYEETLSTLRYANRAKNIKNKAVINEDPKDALLRQYQEEITKLKALLAGQLGLDPAAALAALNAVSGAAGPKAIGSSGQGQSRAARQQGAGASNSRSEQGADDAEEEKEEAARSTSKLAADAAEVQRMRQQQAEELKRREEALKREYDAQLASLQQAYEEQRMTNEKLEQEFERLTAEFNSKQQQVRKQAAAAAVGKRPAKDKQGQAAKKGAANSTSTAASPARTRKSAPAGQDSQGEEDSQEKSRQPSQADVQVTDLDAAGDNGGDAVDAADANRLMSLDAMVPSELSSTITLTKSLLSPLHAMASAELPSPTFDIVPELYVVLDRDGQPTLAVRQPGSQTFYKAAQGPDGLVHPVMNDEHDQKPIALTHARLAEADAVTAVVDAHPPRPVVAVGTGRQPLPALLGPDKTPAVACLTAWQSLEPAVRASDDELELVLGPDGLPAAIVELGENSTIVVNKDGQPEVAFVTSEGLPVRAMLDSSNKVVPWVAGPDSANVAVPILGPDGLAAQPVASKLPCRRLTRRPIVVLGAEAEPVIAVTSADGVPIAATFDQKRHVFCAQLGSDGKPQPLLGSGGQAAAPMVVDDGMICAGARKLATVSEVMAAKTGLDASKGKSGEIQPALEKKKRGLAWTKWKETEYSVATGSTRKR